MQKIDILIKEAMKSRHSEKLTAFRSVKAKMMLEKTKETPTKLGDEELFLQMVRKEVKERVEANSYFKDKEHPQCQENQQIIEILTEFLPRQLSAAEQEKLIKDIILKKQLAGTKNFGAVMKELTPHKLSLDMKLASSQVKKLLN